jgi:hypothetical protein
LDLAARGYAHGQRAITRENIMTDLWNYRVEVDTTSLDLVGYDVEATDGHIGTVDEASADAGDSYLVVDTGFWIFGKKRVIPARAVKQVNLDTKVVYLDMTRDQVKDAPDHHPHWTDPDQRESFAGYYGQMMW